MWNIDFLYFIADSLLLGLLPLARSLAAIEMFVTLGGVSFLQQQGVAEVIDVTFLLLLVSLHRHSRALQLLRRDRQIHLLGHFDNEEVPFVLNMRLQVAAVLGSLVVAIGIEGLSLPALIHIVHIFLLVPVFEKFRLLVVLDYDGLPDFRRSNILHVQLPRILLLLQRGISRQVLLGETVRDTVELLLLLLIPTAIRVLLNACVDLVE